MRPRVAIIGIGCRLTGARSAIELADLLARPPAPPAPPPAGRWDAAAHGPAPAARWIDDEELDFRVFHAPPAQLRELHRMERVALACGHQAIVDAAIGRGGRERGAVHVAATGFGVDPAIDPVPALMQHDVERALASAVAPRVGEAAAARAADELRRRAPRVACGSVLTTGSITAGRLAGAFDLAGGHAAHDAGPASGLAALAAAIDGLESGDNDLALVVGLSPLLGPLIVMAHRRAGHDLLLAEGAIALCLEREDDARRAGRRIYALVDAVGRAAAGQGALAVAVPRMVARAARRALAGAAQGAEDIGAVWSPTAGDRGLRAVYPADRPIRSAAARLGHLGGAGALAEVAAAALTLCGGERRAAVSAPGPARVAFHAILSAAAEPAGAGRAELPVPARVAVAGLGVVVPGAASADELWQLVMSHGEAVAAIPASRFDAGRLRGAAAAQAPAGLLPPVVVDHRALRLAPAAALRLDPAVALTVEACRQAIAEAGGLPAGDRTGVIVAHLPVRRAERDAERALFVERARATVAASLEASDVPAATAAEALAGFADSLGAGTWPVDEHTLAATTSATLAERVADIWDLRGCAQAVDAACASSLAAMQLGMRALERGELDAVVVAAASYSLFDEFYAALAALGALASRPSHAFHTDANGLVPAEGACAVVLRRAADAPGQVLLRSVALAGDGRGTALLAPSIAGEERALRRAYAAAGIDPATVDLLEAHGSGTPAGDAAELTAYGHIFGGRDVEHPVHVGSIKSNIGHLFSAAGLAGVIKATLALRHRTLPPARRREAARALASGPLRLTDDAKAWSAPAHGVRRAAVSGFGLGGINAHLVLEEAAAPRVATLLEVGLAPAPLQTAAAPRPGRVLVAGPAGHPIVAELVARLGGAVVWDPSPSASLAEHEAALAAIDCDGRVIDAVAVTRDEPALAAVRRGMALGRALHARWARGEGCYLALTAMGGGLGLTRPRPAGAAPGGALCGLVKALRQELPALRARAIDVDPAAADLVDVALAELAADDDLAEVGHLGGQRLAPVMRPRAVAPRAPLPDGAVVLFSGGGRGVTAVCAQALARRGVTVVVTGRTAAPRGDEPWLALGEADRVPELMRRRRAEPGLTPAAFAREWRAQEAARELRRNLLAAPLEYHVLDVADAAACRRLVDDVRRRHGRLDAVVHGAMVEESRALLDKQPAMIDATVAVKVDGLANLLAAAGDVPLVVAFGSLAGRLGNRGQVDYSAANDAVARLLAAEPGRRAVTIDWTAWSDVGAAAEPRTAELLRAAGLAPIDPAEGAAWFLDVLDGDVDGEVVVARERDVRAWPRSPAPDAWPLVDRTERHGAALTTERSFTLERDLFLAEHRLHEESVVPAAFLADALAEAAVLARGGGQAVELLDFTIDGPVRVAADGARLLRVHAVPDGAGGYDVRAVTVGPAGEIPRCRARVRVVDVPAPLGRSAAAPDHEGRRPSVFDAATRPITLGPAFRNVAWVARTQAGVSGQLRAPGSAGLFAGLGAPRFQLDPLVLDAAFQVASHCDLLGDRPVFSVPVGFDRLRIGAPRPAGCGAEVVARATGAGAGRDLVCDVTVACGGEARLELSGLHLRRLDGPRALQ